MSKKYSDILEERKIGTGLIVAERENTLTKIRQSAAEMTELAMVGDTDAMLKKVQEVVPHVNNQIMLSNPGISDENRQKLAVIKDELTHAVTTMPSRRTDLEKRMSVLQANRFTTPGAQYHQAKLEQAVHYGNLVDSSIGLEVQKIRLEKMLYKYQQLKEKIESYRVKGKKTFLLEKDLQLKGIRITQKLMTLDGLQRQADSSAMELLEWSKIKEERFEEAQRINEFWNPDDINEGQMIPLAQRFFQNYITSHQPGAEQSTSDIINIDGLALTAMKEGLRDGTLGAMMEGLADEQIALLWAGIFGRDVVVERPEGLIIFNIKDANGNIVQNLVFPTSMQRLQEMRKVQEQLLMENKEKE